MKWWGGKVPHAPLLVGRCLTGVPGSTMMVASANLLGIRTGGGYHASGAAASEILGRLLHCIWVVSAGGIPQDLGEKQFTEALRHGVRKEAQQAKPR